MVSINFLSLLTLLFSLQNYTTTYLKIYKFILDLYAHDVGQHLKKNTNKTRKINSGEAPHLTTPRVSSWLWTRRPNRLTFSIKSFTLSIVHVLYCNVLSLFNLFGFHLFLLNYVCVIELELHGLLWLMLDNLVRNLSQSITS